MALMVYFLVFSHSFVFELYWGQSVKKRIEQLSLKKSESLHNKDKNPGSLWLNCVWQNSTLSFKWTNDTFEMFVLKQWLLENKTKQRFQTQI